MSSPHNDCYSTKEEEPQQSIYDDHYDYVLFNRVSETLMRDPIRFRYRITYDGRTPEPIIPLRCHQFFLQVVKYVIYQMKRKNKDLSFKKIYTLLRIIFPGTSIVFYDPIALYESLYFRNPLIPYSTGGHNFIEVFRQMMFKAVRIIRYRTSVDYSDDSGFFEDEAYFHFD
ncbi:hypothetical protein HZS_1847 [Henneguya salminicola]|nr:hypothetical protein HZS_1847 [Henneguya salminicola]